MSSPRRYFNPCFWRGVIYLCGSWSTLIEAFSPVTESFLPTPLSITQSEYDYDDRHWCLYVESDLLVVLSYDRMRKFTTDVGGRLTKVMEIEIPGSDKGQNSSPVIVKDVVYVVWWGACVGFNKETGASEGIQE